MAKNKVMPMILLKPCKRRLHAVISEVETLGENVVVNFTPTEAEQKDLPQLLQKTLNAIEKAKAATGKSEQDVLFGGIEGQLAQLANAASEAAQSSQQQAEAKAESNKKAQVAEDELKVALKQEIGQGLSMLNGKKTR